MRLVIGLLTLIATTAWARVPSLGTGEPLGSEASLLDQRYQIGDQWGKQTLSDEELNTLTSLRKIAYATANLRGATSFYLGEFEGAHLLATNNHVCPNEASCRNSSASFGLLGDSAKVAAFLGSWPEIDLTILRIDVSKDLATRLAPFASSFNFEQDVYAGQKLVTVGFGVASNPFRRLVGNWDDDCVVFSQSGDYRLMADPDEYNQGAYKTWSFANGCDVSHGDSGSAMVDFNTGDVVGIIWTGKVPKSAIVQDSKVIQSWIDTQDELIWKELSYAVPAVKMAEVIDASLQEGKLSAEAANLLKALRGQ